MKQRFRNPWFWLGILGVILTAMGADPQMFTSWAIVLQKFKEIVCNPFMLFTVATAVLGVFVEPTTAGLKDGNKSQKQDQWKERKL